MKSPDTLIAFIATAYAGTVAMRAIWRYARKGRTPDAD